MDKAEMRALAANLAAGLQASMATRTAGQLVADAAIIMAFLWPESNVEMKGATSHG